MCSAPEQTASIPAGVDTEKETVITGRILDDAGQPVSGAYVRLLDASDDFTAEVVTSATGHFRFYAAPGTWTIRALSRLGNASQPVTADGPGILESNIVVA